MKTQPERHNILILTLNMGTGNGNTIIVGSSLDHSNNSNATPAIEEQEFIQIIKILQEENARLKLTIKGLRELVELLSQKDTNK